MRSIRSANNQDAGGGRTRRRLHVVRALLIAFLCSLLASEQADAGGQGILGQPAPPLWANAWFNLPGDTGSVDLEAYRGQVVYLLFFQSWCPGCHRHGFPTLKEVRDHYAAREDVIFFAVQTVFEGFGTNDPVAARRTMAKFELEIPFGHDAGPDQEGSLTMRRYRAGGTPWTVIIDREGAVRFNSFQIKPGEAIERIDRLLAMNYGGAACCPRRAFRDPREVLNGVSWILRTGAPWKDLPDRYPPRRGEVASDLSHVPPNAEAAAFGE